LPNQEIIKDSIIFHLITALFILLFYFCSIIHHCFEIKEMLIYGRHPVLDAIQSDQTVEKVLIQQGVTNEFTANIRSLSKTHQFVLQYVPKEKLNKLVDANHQGVVAYISEVTYYNAEPLLFQIMDKQLNPLVLILDGITDVRNFGAIARSAECAGVDAIILQHTDSAPINAASIKASAGALTKIKIGRINSFGHLIGYLQNSGWQVVASDLQATQSIMEVDFKTPTAVVMGSESRGVSKYLLKAVDETFKIPQIGETDSFNVSVATGIIVYEAMRQKIEL